jgi:hypothetical protein
VRRFTAALFGIEVLAFAVWLGTLVALALAAPAIFQTVPSRDLAGRVFGNVLARLFPLIYGCGAMLLFAGLVRDAIGGRISRAAAARIGLTGIMLALAMYAGIVVYGEMRQIQASLPAPIETLPIDSGPRARFDTLHKLSERLMGVNALLALALLPFLLRGAPVEGTAESADARRRRQRERAPESIGAV